MINIAKFIDYTYLKADGTKSIVERMCLEAKEYGFAAICIHPVFVKLCAQLLSDTPVSVATVVGFPFGANTSTVKSFEAVHAVKDGATEIDMVMNVGAMLSGNTSLVQEDIETVVTGVAGKALVKVIIETAYLNKEEIVTASKIVQAAGADFVKTSTGFAPSGAKIEDIKLIRSTVGPDFGIKAAGGVSSYQVALAMLEAGATRFGASAALEIVKGGESTSSY